MTMLSPDEVQRRALRAAAKVALAFSTASVFGACGGQVAQVPGGKDDAEADAATTTDAAVDDTFVVADAIVDATSCGAIGDAATPTQLACCAAKVRATFPVDVAEPVDAGGAPDGGSPDPSLQACCGELIKVYDGTPDHDFGLSWAQARACCYALPGPWFSHAGLACTPWGPPMPPPMPGVEDVS